jgi:cytochrome P460
VSCRFSKERLALYVEGDLSAAADERTGRHLTACDECRRFLDRLRQRQALLKSLRQAPFTSIDCSRMRRDVMAIISARPARPGWAVRVESALLLGIWRRPYALATAALLCVVSVSLVAQMRHTVLDTPRSEAFFLGTDTLVRPAGYRDWIVVGSGFAGADHRGTSRTGGATRTVYINPSAYRAYAKTGEFPEGTLMVWEASAELDRPSHGEKPGPALLASVKDSARFAQGWGFFDFTAVNGEVLSKAEPVPESSGCRTCHQRDAATDHVFTQFYPVLQSAHRGVQVVPLLRSTASPTDPLASA